MRSVIPTNKRASRLLVQLEAVRWQARLEKGVIWDYIPSSPLNEIKTLQKM